MSSEPTEVLPVPVHDEDASHRQRFGLFSVLGLGSIAAVISFLGTRERWAVSEQSAETRMQPAARTVSDAAWDYPLPAGPHRDEFQSSCLICHSARLPLSQPRFRREKWTEIVHKMVAVYGAPLTPEDESHVVDYVIAARPPAS